jgi:hypothetical protein
MFFPPSLEFFSWNLFTVESSQRLPGKAAKVAEKIDPGFLAT